MCQLSPFQDHKNWHQVLVTPWSEASQVASAFERRIVPLLPPSVCQEAYNYKQQQRVEHPLMGRERRVRPPYPALPPMATQVLLVPGLSTLVADEHVAGFVVTQLFIHLKLVVAPEAGVLWT